MLGGCGGIGSVAVRALAAGDWFDEIVVADVRADEAARTAAATGQDRVTSAAVDATQTESVQQVVAGASVVVNCVGPFYRFGAPVLEAVIGAGVDYVDVCDDLDATRAQLELDGAAREAGVCAVIGMGNSPGLANMLARYAADELLDEVTGVDIMHIHGGEPEEGAAVVKHRIHAMTSDVPVFVDGSFQEVRLLEESGAAFVEETDFREIGRFPVYPYPHPETITLPEHLPGLQRATNKGVVLPLSYFEHTMDTVRAGLAGPGPHDEDAIDRWVEAILVERPRLLAAAGLTGPQGCLKVVVDGRTDGEDHRYVFSLSTRTGGAGEGTGLPAAMAGVLVLQGKIAGAGVHPPEAVVPPLEIMALAGEVLPHFGMGPAARPEGPGAEEQGEDGADPMHIEHIRADGTSQAMAFPL